MGYPVLIAGKAVHKKNGVAQTLVGSPQPAVFFQIHDDGDLVLEIGIPNDRFPHFERFLSSQNFTGGIPNLLKRKITILIE